MNHGEQEERAGVLEPRLCDEPAARAYLGGVSRSTLWRRESEGLIRSVKLSGRRMWLVESLRDYVDAELREQQGGGTDAAA